jgi:EAL domain-containing protein (putative c-di-GMP-specific phosphodiesterase class I)
LLGCADNQADASVCKSIIELAHNFGSKAAAVGIETSEDVRKLVELGCDGGQGYLFAKPMTEQELMGMVMAARGASKSADQPAESGTISPKAE